MGSGDVARRALPWLTRRFRSRSSTPARGGGRAAGNSARFRGGRPRRPPQPAPLRHRRRRAAFCAAAATGDGDPRMEWRACWPRWQAVESPQVVYAGTTGFYGDCAGWPVDETRPCRAQTARGRRGSMPSAACAPFWPQRRAGGPAARARHLRRRPPAARAPACADPVLAADEDVPNHIHAEDLARIACPPRCSGRRSGAPTTPATTRACAWATISTRSPSLRPAAPRRAWRAPRSPPAVAAHAVVHERVAPPRQSPPEARTSPAPSPIRR